MPKKILYLIGSKDPGGAERVLADIARSFRSLNYDVTVGHLGNPWLEKLLATHSIRNIRFNFSDYYSSQATDWLFVLNLIKFIRRHRFDLVHAHLFGMILYGTLACKFLNIPIIGTIHDKYYTSEKPYRILVYKVVTTLGCRLVTVSNDIAVSLVNHFGIQPRDLTTIHNGIDLSSFGESFNMVTKRNSYKIKIDDFVLMSVGRLVKIKGHSFLIRCASNILKKVKGVKIIIVGDGPERPRLQSLAQRYGIQDNFIFTGLRNDVPELLQIADVFVQTSFSEGLSCTIIEAIAAGCPVIVTDVGGNREIISNEQEGYIVPMDDSSCFEEKIISLISNTDLRKNMSLNAKKRAREKFSIERMIADYKKLYEHILI